MKNKKRKRSFWTLDRRGDGGFTLVELIVVIAILAVLAGVGTAGYSGYIKNSNKNADKVTIGNIQRALEVGIYSNSFKLPETLQLGAENGVTYPVGFIVLTKEEDGTNGIQLLSTCSTYSTGNQSNACHIVNANGAQEVGFATLTYLKTVYAKYGIGEIKASADVYSVALSYPEYCSTHTKLPSKQQVVTDATQQRFTVETSKEEHYILDDCVGLYKFVTGHTEGEYRETTEIISGGDGLEGVNNQVLQDALEMAFGSSWSDLTLKYDGWTGQTSASFYANAAAIYGTLDTRLSTVVNQPAALQEMALSQSYESTDELAVAFAEKVAALDEATWITNWEITDNSSAESLHFEQAGFGLSGREFYSAARAMYNACFAAYLTNNGHGEHADKIEAFASPVDISGFDIDIGLPAVICRSAFVSDESELDDAVKGCTTCKNLYEQYVSSGASRENAKATYATMSTVSDTATEIDKTGGYSSATFFTYYNQYLNEFAGLYQNVKTLTQGKSAVVITVYYTNGVLTYDISPSAANPRN